jgi:hypothetical protein
MNYLLLGIPIVGILYAFGLWFWLKRTRTTIPDKYLRALLWTHGVLLFLILIAIWLSYYEMHFRGQSTNRIIIWGFLITGVATAFFTGTTRLNILVRLYFRIFSSLIVFACLFVFVPFIGPIATFSYLGQLTGNEDTVFYNDPEIRIQNTFIGVLGPPRVDVYQKEGLLEKRIFCENIGGYSIDSVKKENKGGVSFFYLYHTDTPDVASPLWVKITE